ncbi:MAG: TraB/VirB10 family protein [Campylobacterales bacterium]|nr:TraB/VirB10 family protein [Campylobacterales bacterium]
MSVDEYLNDGDEENMQSHSVSKDVDKAIFDKDKLLDNKDKNRQKKKVLKQAVIFIAAIGLLVAFAKAFYKADRDLKVEDVRREAKVKKLPPDLNISSDSIIDQEAKNLELQDLRKKVDAYEKERNNTGNLTKTDIANIVADELRKQQKNSYSSSTQNADKKTSQKSTKLSKLPSRAVITKGVKVPVDVKKLVKKENGNDVVGVDDFLTVKSDDKKNPAKLDDALVKVGATSKQGVKMTPTTSSETQQPSHLYSSASNGASSSGYQIKIEDSQDLKTSYSNTQSAKKEKKKEYYLSAGMVKASLHTGFRAPTLSINEENMQPVILTIDSEILGPNDSTLDAEDCFVRGVAKGDLNSGRAIIRVTNLDCNLKYKNGKTAKITKGINAFVYGEDSLHGIKGRLVSSEGKIIESALPITLIQALIGALSNTTATTQMVIPGIGSGTYSPTSGTSGMLSGAIQGASKGANTTLDQIVTYYMKILQDLNPAIEVLGGRNGLTIVFKGGETITPEDVEFLDLKKIGAKQW